MEKNSFNQSDYTLEDLEAFGMGPEPALGEEAEENPIEEVTDELG